MLAISQSGENYYYLNWVPSEAGPMVTQHGSIKKALEHPDKIDEHYYEVLDEIFSNVKNGDPICTFSLDSSNVLFSTCYAENNIEETHQAVRSLGQKTTNKLVSEIVCDENLKIIEQSPITK